MNEKLHLIKENFFHAWTSCMVMMVQGDFSQFSWGHVGVASKVGLLTGLSMYIASFLPWKSKWIGIYLVGLFTMLSDFLLHHAGFQFEALSTGLGAMICAILYEKITKKNIA